MNLSTAVLACKALFRDGFDRRDGVAANPATGMVVTRMNDQVRIGIGRSSQPKRQFRSGPVRPGETACLPWLHHGACNWVVTGVCRRPRSCLGAGFLNPGCTFEEFGLEHGLAGGGFIIFIRPQIDHPLRRQSSEPVAVRINTGDRWDADIGNLVGSEAGDHDVAGHVDTETRHSVRAPNMARSETQTTASVQGHFRIRRENASAPSHGKSEAGPRPSIGLHPARAVMLLRPSGDTPTHGKLAARPDSSAIVKCPRLRTAKSFN